MLEMVDYGTEALQDSARLMYQTIARINDLEGLGRSYISIMDGITMGGGLGVAICGKYRVATERSMLAMPEAAVGLSPDVGTSYFFSRLQGQLGLFLGLTGFRLKGYDVLKAGLATHYVPSTSIPQLEHELLAGSDIERTLSKFASVDNKTFSLEPHLTVINKCFSADTVEEIFKGLRADNSDFAKATLKSLSKAAPTSLKTTKRAFDQGKNLDLKQCLKTDLRIITRHLMSADFKEGVRAFFVDKDQKPNWNPKTPEEVSDQQVDLYFKPFLNENDELKFD